MIPEYKSKVELKEQKVVKELTNEDLEKLMKRKGIPRSFDSATYNKDRQLYTLFLNEMDEVPYIKDAKEMLEYLNLKKGDLVKVFREPTDEEKERFKPGWNPSMSAFVGKAYEVLGVREDCVALEDPLIRTFVFPPWVLRKVKTEE